MLLRHIACWWVEGFAVSFHTGVLQFVLTGSLVSLYGYNTSQESPAAYMLSMPAGVPLVGSPAAGGVLLGEFCMYPHVRDALALSHCIDGRLPLTVALCPAG